MSNQTQTDAVDAILQQWQRERPDLDVRPMGVLGRLGRCAALLRRELEVVFSDFGLSAWEFDVLATLRRSGQPYCLAPTTLFSALMITSGTMTRQLQQLEAAGRVSRLSNPHDARSMLVQLTPAGLELIDRAVTAHVHNQARIVAPLAAAQLAELEARLTDLLAVLEPKAE
ncbi:MarR family transcriptional regulator [Pseudomonas sp. HMWF032]|uniref:MarR family winged helix-turn-helix transcriptional regulator n=1 Tax=Pseudomonas sp. HMWF032 TaxID=2056866 RepID=UPI000D388F31|nr:MarR family transcriptional regulator [Pseudomonas sp. HMWF032]PTS83116.1 MarR family transcriptional regulator [Pseudomonas sp. HMWF032]PTT81505.1 MarR family transcriptional regulator [Pseudomonas sp. HMWF010]